MAIRYTLLLSIATPVILLLFIARSSGSPGGATGSPGDGMTCGTTGCHGTQTPSSTDLVEALIPLTGYTPDSVYSVIVSLAREGTDRYGFELVAEDDQNNPVGTFSDNSRVSAYSGDRRATHRSTSIDSSGENGWEVEWKAPSAGTGQVRFYAAVLAANGNGANNGDSVWIGSYAVDENVPMMNIVEQEPGIELYPNPCSDHLTVHGHGVYVKALTIYDLHGRTLSLDPGNKVHDISELPNGLYFVRIETEQGSLLRRILKQ